MYYHFQKNYATLLELHVFMKKIFFLPMNLNPLCKWNIILKRKLFDRNIIDP